MQFFLFHLLIVSIVYYIINTWFKFFLKLRLTIDFSFLAIVIFGAYAGALLNIHFGLGIIPAIIISRIGSIPFTLLILYLSQRLSQIYFVVGTLALYMFFFQLATNWEGVTNGVLGISGIDRLLRGNIEIGGLEPYLILSVILGLIILLGLMYFKKTYLYTILKWRGENHNVLKVLGVKIPLYTFILIAITALCAVVGANLYSFYYLYIDPNSFWFTMLILLLVVAFVSYRMGEIPTFLTTFVIIFAYEYLRFFKVVDPALLGYVRESLFGLIIMVTSFITFRKTSFGRQH